MVKRRKAYRGVMAPRQNAAALLRKARMFARDARVSLHRGDCDSALSDILGMEESGHYYSARREEAGGSRSAQSRADWALFQLSGRILGQFRSKCLRSGAR